MRLTELPRMADFATMVRPYFAQFSAGFADLPVSKLTLHGEAFDLGKDPIPRRQVQRLSRARVMSNPFSCKFSHK